MFFKLLILKKYQKESKSLISVLLIKSNILILKKFLRNSVLLFKYIIIKEKLLF